MGTQKRFIRSCARSALVALSLGTCMRVGATSGDLDPAFGSGGIATIDFSASDYTTAIARDAAGFLYVAGTSGSPNSNFAVAKFDAGGHLVTAFGAGGKVVVDVGSGSAEFEGGIAVDGSGNVYLGGSSTAALDTDFAIVKLDATGQLVAGFGNGGKVLVDIDGNHSLDFATGVAIDASGNVYLVGRTETVGDSANPQIALLKVDSSGQRVAGFGTNGVEVLRIDGRANNSGSIIVDPDGNLLIGGTAHPATGPGIADTFIAKFNANGQASAGFGTGGVALVHESYSTTGGPLARGGDGMVYASGGAILAGHAYLFVAKLGPNGQPAPGFGTAGSQLVDPADGAYSAFARVAADAAGNVFLASNNSYPGPTRRGSAPDAVDGGFSHIVVAQLDATGTPVDSFGTAGVVSIPIVDRNSSAGGVLLDGDNHVYLGGTVTYDTPVAGNYADDLVMRLLLERPDAIFADGFEMH